MTWRWWHLVIIAIVSGLLAWWLSPARGMDTHVNQPTAVHTVKIGAHR